jgi:hypothetical protein
MKLFSNIFIGIALVTMYSCKGSTIIEKEIVNDSSFDITIKITYMNDNVEEFVVKSNTSTIISSVEQSGGNKDLASCTDDFKEVRSFVSLGRSLNFDPTLDEFWVKKTEQIKKTPARYKHRCVLTIDDTDIN